MATNSLFKTSGLAATTSEQNLYADLVKEAIQIHGHDVNYIDRTLAAKDDIFGEDSLSTYSKQQTIEMYVEDAEGGYQGEKELIQQFGLENRNEITFVVHRTRFDDVVHQIDLESGTDTTSGSILLESGTLKDKQGTTRIQYATFDSGYIRSEEATLSTYASRPKEGDLVFHPVLKKLFEVSFVDHDEPFHQLDNNPVYKLRCKQFEYSSEVLDTGVTDVDAIEDALTSDSLGHQFTLEATSAYNESIALEFFTNGTYTDSVLMEDNDTLVHEDDERSIGTNILLENPADSGVDSYILQETYIIGDMSTDKTAQNELFEEQDDTILDFTESNPFGDAGQKG
jgi:hypothetical protein|tara:strand:+ start:5676 stop:6698 length:1023 start_codon:yes stop_codon:yes gene_type:complete